MPQTKPHTIHTTQVTLPLPPGGGLPAAAVSSIVRVFGEISHPEMTAALQAKVAEVTRGA